MSAPHDIPEAIQWHEGMLLAPQHFQQLASRQERLLQYHAELISPFHWGVRRLAHDPSLLVSGTYRVLDLEAVMPDGLLVNFASIRAEDLEIDLTAHAEAMKQKPLTIHLGVPAAQHGPASGPSEFPRYHYVIGDPVRDEHTGEGDLAIPRLRPRLALIAADAVPAKYVSVPLARVHYQNETFSLTNFVPPCFTIPVQSPIGQVCAQIAKRLREKAVYLSEKAMSPSLKLDSPILYELKAQISTLVAALPYFEGVLSTGVSHPYVVYLALCQLVGHLSSLGLGMLPPALPPYDHNDIRASCEAASAHIERILDHAILTSYTAFPFSLEEGVFQLGFVWTWMTRSLVLGVRADAGMTEADVMQWVKEALIGSTHVIPTLRSTRTLGAERTRISQDEDLVPSRGVVLFSLKADPRFIEAGKTLQVLNTSDRPERPRPAEIVLYVKNVR